MSSNFIIDAAPLTVINNISLILLTLVALCIGRNTRIYFRRTYVFACQDFRIEERRLTAEEGGRIVKVDLPSLWYCLDGRDTAPEEGCIGGCCCVALWGGPEELEVAELAGVDGFLCSGVATWWCPPPPWYPNKSPKSGTHTLSYKFVGTFSREAFAASTSECKTEINPQPDPTAPLYSRARSNNGPSFAPFWNIALLFLYLPDLIFISCLRDYGCCNDLFYTWDRKRETLTFVCNFCFCYL